MRLLKVLPIALMTCSLVESKSTQKENQLSIDDETPNVLAEDEHFLINKSKFPKKYYNKEELSPSMVKNVNTDEVPTFPVLMDSPVIIKNKGHLSSIYPHLENLPIFPETKHLPQSTTTVEVSIPHELGYARGQENLEAYQISDSTHLSEGEEMKSTQDAMTKTGDSSVPQSSIPLLHFNQPRLHGIGGGIMGEIGSLGNNRKDEAYMTSFFPY